MDKALPELYSKRENCCGCSACYSACPVSAIQMNPDDEGFLYPVVDAKKCVRCYRCLSMCAFKKDQHTKGYCDNGAIDMIANSDQGEMYPTPESYAAKHKHEEVRMSSRSGGVFTAISDAVLAEGGVIYGCALTDTFLAEHIRADNKKDRDRMRGSKYIQSDLRDSFALVKQDLQQGRIVLFSGTSCQIAGLREYLGGRDNSRLLCLDILCHGVPSPVVWRSYLDWIEKKQEGKTEAVDFRNKRDFGWRSHVESIYLDGSPRVDSEVFRTLFFGHNILRPCCHSCPYKDIHHPGDITIADYWGIERAAPGFNDNRGISLVLINNDKGKYWFEKAFLALDCLKTELKDSLQPALLAPSPKSDNRERFWRDFDERDFEYIAKRYGGYGSANKIKKVWMHAKKRFSRKLHR